MTGKDPLRPLSLFRPTNYDEFGVNLELPEHNLWFSVLHRTYIDYFPPTEQHHRRAARYWFFSESRQPGSFSWVCGVLAHDPEDFQKKILNSLLRDAPSLKRIREARSHLVF